MTHDGSSPGGRESGTSTDPYRHLDERMRALGIRAGADLAVVGTVTGAAEERILVERVVCLDSSLKLPADFPGPTGDYPLAGSPCQDVLEDCLRIVPEEVASRYPEDTLLATLAVQGYAGHVIAASNEMPKGLVLLLFRQPIRAVGEVRAALEHEALRVAMELERVRFERRLARSERRYRTLVENAQDGILVHRNFRLLYVNLALARLLGYETTAAVMARGTALAFIPEHEQVRAKARIAARMRNEHVPRDYDLDVWHRNGHLVRLRALVSTVEWDGEPALQLALSDASERQEIDERTQQARRLESIGKLTGGIAHDFNNLLAVILGNLELLGGRLSDPEGGQLLRQATQAAERGADLTRRLLSFARRQPLEPRPLVLADLLAETRAMLGPTARPDVDLLMEDAAGVPVLADPSQLQAALLNLVRNAQDAMPGPGCIHIRGSFVAGHSLIARFPEAAPEPHVCIEVADTGTGMPPDVRERAFEPFYSTKGRANGSGLGLSMVHGFVRQSRGQIELESREGDGTRVRLYLPAAEARPQPQDGGAPSEVVEAQCGRILVVEDEPSVREVTVAMLRSFGYQVFAAADSDGARALMERETLDLLITDVVLPGVRGPEIAAAGLALQPEMRVLFMSGYADAEEFREFAAEHGVRLLNKPFRRQTLREAVTTALADDGPAA